MWKATTYPTDNVAGHEQCEFDLSYLSTGSTASTGTNPYWTDNGDGTFAPTYGGLDQYNWYINFRFDTYSQAVFEADLTTFLSATTISCDTFCSSATTAPTLSFPYTSLNMSVTHNVLIIIVVIMDVIPQQQVNTVLL